MARKEPNRYAQLLSDIFKTHYNGDQEGFTFPRTELETTASRLGIKLPKNLGDVIYSFRYRADLPAEIVASAPEGKTWLIQPAGRGVYRFDLAPAQDLTPNAYLDAIKIPESTPTILLKYGRIIGKDEQNLLARLRYNRLIDLFTGATCYSLQNHLRTTVKDIGQVETDELYLGVDKAGAQYVFPVQAKGGTDRMSIVQIGQDIALCQEKFPELICRAIGAQFMDQNTIALFSFRQTEHGPKLTDERHYEMVDAEDITEQDLQFYSQDSSPEP